MSKTLSDNKLTAGERLKTRVLQWAPWLAPFLFALPGPVLFVVMYMFATATETAALYVFLALASLAVGSIAGLIVAIFLVFYRKRWLKQIREKLAADGITADEVSWFTSELTTAERQSLKQIESQNLLLADAYRETLAARLTASRVVASAKRDLLLVERRVNRSSYRQGATNQTLQEELKADRARLERVRQEGTERRAEAEARLQMIEAAASRGQSWSETNAALQRLSATQEHLPLALESAREEQQVREDVEKEMRGTNTPST
ncbi:MAG: hypothetical protein H7Y30_09690 [Pyrinomonadaceae bacterium]|nr:hypothetical protein [Pyrinomonadaceae bacterium]